MTNQQKSPELFLSLPHECSYLPNRQAVTLFVDPNNTRAPDYYDQLLQKGFRRSGRLIYRPHCHGCNACVSVRIPVEKFTPRRGQRRVIRRNQDVAVREMTPYFSEEHFALYQKYQHARHTHGSMDNDDLDAYQDFMVNSPVNTRLFEMRIPGGKSEPNLLAVSVSDVTEDGLSAVYTFFDPDESARAPGVFAILWQIQLAARLNLDYLYLGYWIKECDKMAYKQDYRPLQGFRDGKWTEISP